MNNSLRSAKHRLCLPQLTGRPSKRALLVGFLAVFTVLPAFAGAVSYTYDALGRLAKATYSNGVVITYTYDAAGNRSSQITAGAP